METLLKCEGLLIKLHSKMERVGSILFLLFLIYICSFFYSYILCYYLKIVELKIKSKRFYLYILFYLANLFLYAQLEISCVKYE